MKKANKNTQYNSNINDIIISVITEGMAGTENQCLAITDKLGIKPTIHRISLRFPFNYLCPHLIKTAPGWAIKGIDKNITQPDMIIAAGRKAIPIALSYKDSYTVFIQDPKIDPAYFDLVAAPAHDQLEGINVIMTVAAPNRITVASIQAATNQFRLPTKGFDKVITVLIGGNSKTHTMPSNFADDLYMRLLPYLESHEWGVLMTISRRTPESITENLKKRFNHADVIIWDGTGVNPYQAYLGHADVIMVTEDSTSMLSDACTTGKPVYRIPLEGGSPKFDRLYKALENRCGLRIFEGEIQQWSYEPLNDAQLVADEIKKRFANRG